MSDRYIILSRTGDPVVRTNSLREAHRIRGILQGTITDKGENNGEQTEADQG